MLRPAKGKRKCNCKARVMTRQLGPGMYQQYTREECEECPGVKLVREAETLDVNVEPGMRDGQARARVCMCRESPRAGGGGLTLLCVCWVCAYT